MVVTEYGEVWGANYRGGSVHFTDLWRIFDITDYDPTTGTVTVAGTLPEEVDGEEFILFAPIPKNIKLAQIEEIKTLIECDIARYSNLSDFIRSIRIGDVAVTFDRPSRRIVSKQALLYLKPYLHTDISVKIYRA